jgi:hypothetical protein
LFWQSSCTFVPPSRLLTHPQGIKFYDPEIVGDTPEAVEYRGLANVLDAAAEHLGYTQGKVGGAVEGGGK